MAFRPTEVQVHVLDCLNQLEIEGCPSASLTGKACPPTLTLGSGVPAILLRAWAKADNAEIRKALRSLVRRGLIRQKRIKIWPFLGVTRLRIYDGRVIILQYKSSGDSALREYMAKLPGVRLARGKKRLARKPSAGGTQEKVTTAGHLIEAFAGTPKGKTLCNVREYTEWHARDTSDFYSLTEKGLDLLDDSDGVPVIGELVTLSEVRPLTGLSKRTLERRIKEGKLPAPEFPGGNGLAHKWYWHKLRPALQKVSRQNLPIRFPGSQII